MTWISSRSSSRSTRRRAQARFARPPRTPRGERGRARAPVAARRLPDALRRARGARDPVFESPHAARARSAGEALRRPSSSPPRGAATASRTGLVDEMLQRWQGARGALPLLAFAVARLWERAGPGEAAAHASGVRARSAASPGPSPSTPRRRWSASAARAQPIVREIFRNLVTSERHARRGRARGAAVALPARRKPPRRCSTTWSTRGCSRATRSRGGRGAGPYRVEVVHESLLRAWPRLVRWQAQDEEGAVLRDQLKQAAHLWEEKARARTCCGRGRRSASTSCGASATRARSPRSRSSSRAP